MDANLHVNIFFCVVRMIYKVYLHYNFIKEWTF